MRHPKFTQSFSGFAEKLKKIRIPSRIIFILMGILSTLWFFIRVIPKPQRAGYPCMRAAFPFMSGFIIWLLSITGSITAFRYARKNYKTQKYLVAATLMIAALAFGAYSFVHYQRKALAADNYVANDFFEPNVPEGEGQGIHPGRVVWVHDPDATDETCINTLQDPYFSPDNNNQVVIDEMLGNAILNLTDAKDLGSAWDLIFRNFNKKKGKGDQGYVSGEMIFIKINQGTAGWNSQSDLSRKDNNRKPDAETSPFSVLSILRHLVNEAGIPQENIMVGDPIAHVWAETYDYLVTEFPDVIYVDKQDHSDLGRTRMSETADPVIFYSDNGETMPGAVEDHLYQEMYEADYMINIAALKAHARAGITLTAKNHFGSHTRDGASHLHPSLVAPDNDQPLGTTVGYGKYRVFVDIMGHEKLGENTLLYFIDGLWGGNEATQPPMKFTSAPFNNDWSNSFLVSLDQVALESVCFDILRTEFNNPDDFSLYRPHMYGADDYLAQAADRLNWPEGTVYDPEGDGTPIPSLGVHEHWNNAMERAYSRNLGKDYGIELITIPSELAAHNPFIAREAATPPVIDGEMNDDCWKSAEWYNIDQTWINYGEEIPAEDFSGKYKVMWSASENLMYFFVKIHDDAFIDGYEYPGTGYPNYDIVEVFIDEDKSGGQHIFDNSQTGENAENAFSYHLAANAPADGEVTNAVVACDIAGTSWSNRITPDYASHFPGFAMRKAGNEYYYEFSMKVYNDSYDDANPETSRVNLAENKVLGVSLAYCDNDQDDNERDNFFGSVWVAPERYNSHWENSDDYGKLVLMSSSGVVNHKPERTGSFSDFVLDETKTEFVVVDNLSLYFYDEDGDELLYEVFCQSPNGTFAVRNDSLILTTIANIGGTPEVTVKATDAGGLSASGTFMLIGKNNSPVVNQTVPDVTLTEVGVNYTVVEDLNSIFNDPDNDELEFSVSTDSDSLRVFFWSTQLRIRAEEPFTGEATVTITATDGWDQVETTFAVTYSPLSVPRNALDASLKCYPNPVTDGNLHVEFDEAKSGPVSIRVFSMNGQQEAGYNYMKATGTFKQTINVSDLQKGFYLLEVTFNGERSVVRFTK